MLSYQLVRSSFFCLLLFVVVFPGDIMAQEFKQTVRGGVHNQASHEPVSGAEVVILKGTDPQGRTTSDSLGNFTLNDILPGRYKVTISSTGFETYEEEALVLSGKEFVLDAELQESMQTLEEVTIKASTSSVESPGMHTISIEKTMRVAANFFDPVRMVTSYPGVVAANDQSNAIAAKGYSPNGLLWRLQGLDIVNPNHLANAGARNDKPAANGGGVNILSAQLLDKTDFYSGSLPVQYGNALSGVIDMNLRPGSKSKMEYTGQASLLGLDVAAEGPISKNKRTSFLANYRYSTVGLLSAAGINLGDEKINFQDLSFHVNSDQKRGGNLSLFGFYGLSSNKFEHKPFAEWKEDKDRYDIYYGGNVFGAGITERFKAGNKVSVSFGSAVSGQYLDRNSQSNANLAVSNINSEGYSNDRIMISSFIQATTRIAAGSLLETGVRMNYLNNFIESSGAETYGIAPDQNQVTYYSKTRLKGTLWQPYINWTQQWNMWKLNAGVRYVEFSYNGSQSVEPRVSVQRSFSKGSIIASYGITSQWQSAEDYSALMAQRGSNHVLQLTKAHQAAVDFRYALPGNVKLTTTVYYHQLMNVPASQGGYSTLNQWEVGSPGFMSLLSTGKGKNYGVEALIEKRFYNQFYFMISGSAYRSQYRMQNTYYDTRFSGKFTSSVQTGKEWSRNKNTLGVHIRMLYLGGLREQRIDAFTSSVSGTTVYDSLNGYSQKLHNYFRPDLRISWRKSKPHATRTLSLDIQNVASIRNEAYHYYDTFLQQVKLKYQLGIFPVIVYRIEF